MNCAVTADFGRVVGPIKPMHAINNAPFRYTNYTLLKDVTAAGIPYSRLHDTGGRYGGGVYVDVPNIFRDFSADPTDPAAYDFAFTDHLLAALAAAGAEPFYRLGASIENDHRIRAYNIYPPADPYKWALVCDGIIRHYTQGWADGFYYDIQYWEIWNEPDNEPEIADNPMWKGTMEQYFELYRVTANLLKGRHPGLKIGGYASCGFYSILNTHAAVANSSPRTDWFITFFEKFLAYIADPIHSAPLDFFSWHSYSGIEENLQYADYARKMLDAHGFTATESILNEWNPGIQNRGKPVDAAQICGMMAALQKSSVDMLMYYDGSIGSYNGMWDPLTFKRFWGYYAFPAFNALYRLGSEAQSDTDTHALRVVAATDCSGHAALLLVNNTGADVTVTLQLTNAPAAFVMGRIDADHTLDDGDVPFAKDNLTIPVDGIVLLH